MPRHRSFDLRFDSAAPSPGGRDLKPSQSSFNSKFASASPPKPQGKVAVSPAPTNSSNLHLLLDSRTLKGVPGLPVFFSPPPVLLPRYCKPPPS